MIKLVKVGLCGYGYVSRPEGDDGSGGFDALPRDVRVDWLDPRPDPNDYTPNARIHLSCDDVALTMPSDTARKVAAMLVEAADASDAARGSK